MPLWIQANEGGHSLTAKHYDFKLQSTVDVSASLCSSTVCGRFVLRDPSIGRVGATISLVCSTIPLFVANREVNFVCGSASVLLFDIMPSCRCHLTKSFAMCFGIFASSLFFVAEAI